MIERQFKTLSCGVFKFYPERLFAEYLLPCFVANFLDVKDDSEVNGRAKQEDFMLFVHEIIKSYEEKEYCLEVSSEEIKLPSTCILRNTLKKSNVSVLQNRINLGEILEDKFSGIIAVRIFLGKGFDFLAVNHKVQQWPRNMLLFQEGQQCPWTNMLFMYKVRINQAAKTLGWVKTLTQETHASIFSFFNNTLVFPRVNFFQLLQVWNYKIICEIDNEPEVGQYNKEGIPAMLLQDAEALWHPQILGIYIYIIIKKFDKEKLRKLAKKLQGPGFPGDFADIAFWHLVSNDLLKLKQLFSTQTKKSWNRDDLTLITLELAKSNKCYEDVLKDLTPAGKVKMSKPGEITFFPIKHCRWCGLADIEKFRMCSLCKENPDYSDVNLFCSEKCESESLAQQHEEEHARFLMLRLGMN